MENSENIEASDNDYSDYSESEDEEHKVGVIILVKEIFGLNCHKTMNLPVKGT